ncbi:MAG: phosphatase PAP2 family protein, partial [Bacteroidota bacterium]|nr:phosphatase PAP2 family protein [Bacteroidota bacterium]
MLNKNRYFFIPYLFFLIAGLIILALFSKSELHLLINQHYNSFSDGFFKYSNYLGEGIVVVLAIIGLAFYKFRNALLLLSSIILSSIMAQFFKRIIFHEIPRPKAHFEGIATLHFVEGVQVHSLLSFPSGHATMAFTLFASLAFMVKNNAVKMILFFLAIIASWS